MPSLPFLRCRAAAASLAFAVSLCSQAATAPSLAPPAEPLAATLHLGDEIPWRTDGQEFYERDPQPRRVKLDRVALIDAACAEAKQKGTLVAWHVHRIQESTLHGNQM